MGQRSAIKNVGLNPVPIYLASYPTDSGVNSALGTNMLTISNQRFLIVMCGIGYM